MIQIKQITKARTVNWYEDNNQANLGCRKSPNSNVEINYSHLYEIGSLT